MTRSVNPWDCNCPQHSGLRRRINLNGAVTFGYQCMWGAPCGSLGAKKGRSGR